MFRNTPMMSRDKFARAHKIEPDYDNIVTVRGHGLHSQNEAHRYCKQAQCTYDSIKSTFPLVLLNTIFFDSAKSFTGDPFDSITKSFKALVIPT